MSEHPCTEGGHVDIEGKVDVGLYDLPDELRKRHPSYLRGELTDLRIPAPQKAVGDMTMAEREDIIKLARERKDAAHQQHIRWQGAYHQAYRLEEALTAILYERRWRRERQRQKRTD